MTTTPLTPADLPQDFTTDEWDTALERFTQWVNQRAATTADHYEVEQAFIDLLAEHRHVSVAHGIGPVEGLIRAFGGTPMEGKEKLLGILSAYYYKPRFRPGFRWSYAHDREHGAPLSILGKPFYRA